MSKKTVRRCDVCHRTEGIELEPEDFVTEPLTMTMNGWNGEVLTVACNVVVKSNNPPAEDIVESVIEDYTPLEDMTFQADGPANHLNSMMTDKQIANMDTSMNLASNYRGDLCKCCSHNMVKMLGIHAQWNKVVHF